MADYQPAIGGHITIAGIEVVQIDTA